MPKLFPIKKKSFIVVLGGGIQQTRCIKRCKKLGFLVCCFDINENCEGKKVADIFFKISIKNYRDIILKLSEFKNIVAILAPATEIGNLTACQIANKLDLPYNCEEVVKITSNKLLMREKLDLLSLDNPKYFSLTNEKKGEFPVYLKENSLSFPCIVKPVDSSAGRGITICKKPYAIEEALSYALQESQEGLVIVESIIQGPQFSLETLSFNGEHKLVSIAAQTMDFKEKHVEVGHILPAPISKRKYSVLENYALNLLDGFGIQYGACHIEVRISDEKIYILDFASRMGGWRDLMIESAYGEGYIDEYIKSHVLDEENKINLDFSLDYLSDSKFCVARMAYSLDDLNLLNDLISEGKCEFDSVDRERIKMKDDGLKSSLSKSAGHFLYKSNFIQERSIVARYDCVDLTKDFI